MSTSLTVVVAAVPALVDALNRTGQFASVLSVESTSGLRQLLSSGRLSPGTSDKVFIFADSTPVDTEQSLPFLISRLVAMGTPVVIIATSPNGRTLVQQCPGAGLIEGPLKLNQVLGALSGSKGLPHLSPHPENFDIALPGMEPVAAPPPQVAAAPSGAAPAPSPFGAAPAASPFGAAGAPAPAPAASPFGAAPAASPFGAAPAASPFGAAPAASPFGAAPAPAPADEQTPERPSAPRPGGGFAGYADAPAAVAVADAPAASPFGQAAPAAPAASPFGQPAPTGDAPAGQGSPSPFGQPAPSAAAPFGSPAGGAPFQQPAATPYQPATTQPVAGPFGAGQMPAAGTADPFGTPAARVGADVASRPQRRGHVITVTAPKGGTGKSSMTLNLAAYLGLRLRGTGRNVCLVDANVQQADAGKYLNAWTPNIEGLLKDQSAIHPDRIMDHLLHKPQLNMSALLGPASPEVANPLYYTGRRYSQILDALKANFDYILIDTPVAELYHDIFREFALPRADFIAVVAAPNVTTLMNTDSWLRQVTAPLNADGMGIDPSKIGVVLNRAEDDIGIDEDEVRRELAEWRFLASVPETKEWKRCNNMNEIVATRNYHELNEAFSIVLQAATGEDLVTGGSGLAPTKSTKRGLSRWFSGGKK